MPLFSTPRLTGKYVGGVLERRWLTTGPECERLKEAVAGFVGVETERVVLASSATVGFLAVLDMVRGRLERRISVEMTKATWPGMWQMVGWVGGEVAFEVADVVVTTDIGGANANLGSPEGPRGALVVHDACHSWLPHRQVDFALMSFYPTKLVPGAEGGVVVCARSQDAEELEWRLNCGIQPVAGAGVDRVITPRWRGVKGNMTDIQAALNREALEVAPRYIFEIATAHRQLREVAEDLSVPYRFQRVRPYLFQAECPYSEVRRVRQELHKRGIPSAWNFPPAGLVTLPCFPEMTKDQARVVVRNFKEVTSAVPREEV